MSNCYSKCHYPILLSTAPAAVIRTVISQIKSVVNLYRFSAQVGFLSDVHGHLCEAEVIGLLAGKWDAVEKRLFVQASFPCTSTVRQEDDGSTGELLYLPIPRTPHTEFESEPEELLFC